MLKHQCNASIVEILNFNILNTMNGKTPVSALQELMAAKKLHLPTYVEEGFGISFKCTVHVAGITAVGFSSSKKSAKHESAKNALEQLVSMTKHQQIVVVTRPSSSSDNKPFKNYIGELNDFSSKHGLKYPDYDFVTVGGNGEFYFKCLFLGKEVFGKGTNKKAAKQDSANKMLELIKSTEPWSTSETYKLIQTSTKFVVEEKEKIISMYKAVSLEDSSLSSTQCDHIEPIPELSVYQCDNVDVLKAKLRQFGVIYTLSELQRNPIIMCVKISGTDLYFIQCDKSREEATRKVLLDVLEALKSGCSLNTNNLISFD